MVDALEEATESLDTFRWGNEMAMSSLTAGASKPEASEAMAQQKKQQ
jgi:hypothetical protein